MSGDNKYKEDVEVLERLLNAKNDIVVDKEYNEILTELNAIKLDVDKMIQEELDYDIEAK